ncbi:MAG: hypothetical protein AAFR55_09295 [Pseudomonadota bacterium]
MTSAQATPWTPARLAQRAALGLFGLCAMVFGLAYMLHETTARAPGQGADRLTAIETWASVPFSTASATGISEQVAPTDDTTAVPTVWLVRASLDAAAGPLDRRQIRRGSHDLMLLGLPLETVAPHDACARAATADEKRHCMYGSDSAIIDRALATGWDGVVLHIGKPTTAHHAELSARLERIADYTRRLHSSAIVGVSGDETFLARTGVVGTIDAVFKQLPPVVAKAAPSKSAALIASRHYLDRAKRAGRHVFVSYQQMVAPVDRLSSAPHTSVDAAVRAYGYVPAARSAPTINGAGEADRH